MSFTSDINKGVEDIKGGFERTIRGAAIACFKGIIQSSPVDTGRFRANWFADGASASEELTDGQDKSGNNTINKMTDKVLGLKAWTNITLTNNLPYAERLEFGHSNQAPLGMVRLNLARIAQNLNAKK